MKIDRLIEWLVEKWGNDRACPYCGNTYWAIGGKLVALPVFRESGTIPAFQVTCKNCGHVVLVSAEESNLWPPTTPESSRWWEK